MVKQEITNGAITKAIEKSVSNGNESTGSCSQQGSIGTTGSSGCNVLPGARSNSYKYHFKGKYPKPR